MTWTPKAIHAPFLLNAKVRELIDVFRTSGNGDAIRFVGGCVRNVLMNLPISDIDIATTLTPDEVGAIFKRAGFNVHPTGIEHGTVTVSIHGEPFEITTLRKDVETDGRRAVIEYTRDWAEDAERRDFRCNALYMDADGNLYDYVGGGIQDALERRLVFVGDPETRIREDYLRILRLFRFMATLGAEATVEGTQTCMKLKAGLAQISGERIEKEMLKLLGADAEGARKALVAMIASQVITEAFGPVRLSFSLTYNILGATTDPVLRLASLFAIDDAAVGPLFARWKSSTAVQQRVRAAIADVCRFKPKDREEIVQTAYRVGMQATRDRMALTWGMDLDTDISFDDVMALADDIEANLPTFPLRGADVLALGVQPGRAVGQYLKMAEAWWVDNGYPDAESTRAHLAAMIESDRRAAQAAREEDEREDA